MLRCWRSGISCTPRARHGDNAGRGTPKTPPAAGRCWRKSRVSPAASPGQVGLGLLGHNWSVAGAASALRSTPRRAGPVLGSLKCPHRAATRARGELWGLPEERDEAGSAPEASPNIPNPRSAGQQTPRSPAAAGTGTGEGSPAEARSRERVPGLREAAKSCEIPRCPARAAGMRVARQL